MNTYRIGLVKENTAEATRPGMNPSDKLVMTLDWFKDKYFDFRKESVQKEFVKARLENIDSEELGFENVDVEKKERIMVHKKPSYKMEDAVFDEKIVVPKNLRTKKDRKSVRI